MNAAQERTRSLWMRDAELPQAPRLDRSLVCDVVIAGAGIAGLSVAYELSRAGLQVVVLDRGEIAGGMTPRTTAHLAPVCDDGVAKLIEARGEDIARRFQESQEAAVDRIEAIVETHGLRCNFRRLDAFLFPALNTARTDAQQQIAEEYAALQKVGAAVERVKGVPLVGFEAAPAIRYRRQGAFHPLKYVQGLVRAIQDAGGRIFANSPIGEVEENGESVKVVTPGGSVSALAAIFATNSPINDRAALHSKMAPYRTYAMAFTVPKDTLPDALYWDMADPYHYVRLNPGPGGVDYLIAGGEDHKSGEANDGAVRFEAIEAWIRALVPALGREVARWSGQVLDTVDYCGFIGRNPQSERTYVATGDSGQGMTHGVLAGLLIRDLLTSGESPWRDVYDPARKTGSAALNFVRENVTAIQNFAEYLMPGDLDSVESLKPGEGGIFKDGLHPVAACRDHAGKLHRSSAVCTHLGCIVRWNATEQCWDCPCHGSQFAPDGAVLNAPAMAPLERHRTAAKQKA